MRESAFLQVRPHVTASERAASMICPQTAQGIEWRAVRVVSRKMGTSRLEVEGLRRVVRVVVVICVVWLRVLGRGRCD